MKAIVLIPTRERKMKCTQFFPNEATSDKMAHSLFEAESTNRKKKHWLFSINNVYQSSL